MADPERADELSPLLIQTLKHQTPRPTSDVSSIISSRITKEEAALASTSLGERLPYNDYTTIDWLHDLVKDSFRHRAIRKGGGFRVTLRVAYDKCQGWIACALIGFLTACVAYVVDIGVETLSDLKFGHCSSNYLKSRDACCRASFIPPPVGAASTCPAWKDWETSYTMEYTIFTLSALVMGIASCALTTYLTQQTLPSASDTDHHESTRQDDSLKSQVRGKMMFMASGSGIPEIKTILSGFVIPDFLTLRVLLVKAGGAMLAVPTTLNLGKEGPFVHISTCVGYLVGRMFPKYRENGRKMRELLSAACSSGLSVAFGAPIGGVLFSYEEISTYFPRRVLWRSFLCSMVAAATLRMLNPTGTGKLVLFETGYGTRYKAVHYGVFVILGLAGGLFGGVFCKANFMWSKWFRGFGVIKRHPVLETALIVLITALCQYPSVMTRETGDVVMKKMLVSCNGQASQDEWVCRNEAEGGDKGVYIGWLIHGTLSKLVLTIVTFGLKVPSGIIIPSLDAGAFFGRLIGQFIPGMSPGIFALVGSAAFLAGVSRMTISLCVIMFELTGELEYILPCMIAILIAKWVADALEKEGVYDLAQAVLGHPFLDEETAIGITKAKESTVEELIPPKGTMEEITVEVRESGIVNARVLEQKLGQLRRRGLMDAGLVLTHHDMVMGYLAQGELEFALGVMEEKSHDEAQRLRVRVLGAFAEGTASKHFTSEEGEGQTSGDVLDVSMFVDRTPLTINSKAPMEYAVELFGKLGLRYLCIVDGSSGKLRGVVIKKRLVAYLEHAKEE